MRTLRHIVIGCVLAFGVLAGALGLGHVQPVTAAGWCQADSYALWRDGNYIEGEADYTCDANGSGRQFQICLNYRVVGGAWYNAVCQVWNTGSYNQFDQMIVKFTVTSASPREWRTWSWVYNGGQTSTGTTGVATYYYKP